MINRLVTSAARIGEGITIALDSLRANKVRAALTILGVAIGVMVVIVIGHIVADRTTCRATQTRADQATGGTTDTVADDLTTRCTKTAANGRLGLLAALGSHRAPGRATYAGSDRSASAASHSLADHAPKSAAETATDSRVGRFASEGVLRYKQAQCNDSECFTHQSDLWKYKKTKSLLVRNGQVNRYSTEH